MKLILNLTLQDAPELAARSGARFLRELADLMDRHPERCQPCTYHSFIHEETAVGFAEFKSSFDTQAPTMASSIGGPA